MPRQAFPHLIVIALFVLLAVAAVGCSGSESEQAEGPRIALHLPTVEAQELQTLGAQYGLGDSFTVDASPMPGPIGEPALKGSLAIQFDSSERDVTVDEETVPRLGASYAAGQYRGEQYVSKRGVYFIVNYTVTNETDGLLKPGAHINGSFTLADSAGRDWKPMDFVTDDFDGSAAFALQQDLFDPREFVLQGEQKSTTIAFDIAEDATDLRLRSALLGIEVKLDQ